MKTKKILCFFCGIAVFILFYLCLGLFELIGLRLGADLTLSSAAGGLAALGIGTLLWALFKEEGESVLPPEQKGGPKRPGLMALALVWGFCLNLFLTFLLTALSSLGGVMDEYAESSGAVLAGDPLFTLLAAGILAPLYEELIFRGLILKFFQKAVPFPAALLLSSVLFGLVHGQLVWSCYAGVVGLLYGLLNQRAGSVWHSVFAHLGFNLTAFLLQALPLELTGSFSPLAFAGVALIPAAASALLWVFMTKAGKKGQTAPAAERDERFRKTV